MKHNKKAWLLAMVCLAAGPAQAGTIAYVGNAASNDVSVMELDEDTGELTEVQTVALPNQPGGTTPMAISPDKRFLLVGIRSKPFTVATFAIDHEDGKLTHVGDGPLADSMAYIYPEKTGHFLLSASYPGHKITVSPIGENGVVGAPQQEIDDIPFAHSIQTDAANRFALAPSLGSDSVRQFSFDEASGKLSASSPDRVMVHDKDGPRHFAFDPSGRHVYLLTEASAKLYVFDYDSQNGQLTQKQEADLTVEGYVPSADSWLAADLHMTPNGKFLYTSVRSTSTLSAFRVDAETGMVSEVGTFPTETFPRGFAIDPTGHYLLAAGQLSDHVMAYSIDQDTGALTILKRYAVGDNPNWIEFVTLP